MASNYAFEEVFNDETRKCRKIPTKHYQNSGKFPIIDQGRDYIAGYTDSDEGLFTELPVIVFGDHTRVFKYVDKPFFSVLMVQRWKPCKY